MDGHAYAAGQADRLLHDYANANDHAHIKCDIAAIPDSNFNFRCHGHFGALVDGNPYASRHAGNHAGGFDNAVQARVGSCGGSTAALSGPEPFPSSDAVRGTPLTRCYRLSGARKFAPCPRTASGCPALRSGIALIILLGV